MRNRPFLCRCLCLLALFIGISISAQQKPDFAYPKKVSANAEKQLDKALKSNNGKLAVRSLLNLMIAQSSISSDSIPVVLSKIEQTQQKISDPSTRALLDLLTARIYHSVYTSNKYKYDARSLPLTPLPKDYTEWSGEQFRHEISRLCDETLSLPQILQSENIADYNNIITVSDLSRQYYPTLYDFVASDVISIRKSLTPISNMFSILLLTPRATFIVSPRYVATSNEARKILDIYSELLRFHAHDTAPLIMNDIARIQFTTSGIYHVQALKAEDKAMELLENLYDTYSTSQYSGDILLAMCDMNNSTKLYGKLTDFTKRHPNYSRINNIRNRISQLSQPTLNIQLPSITSLGREVTINIHATNTDKAVIKIFRVPDKKFTGYGNVSINPSTLTAPVAEYALSISGTVPFTCDTTITFTPDKYGAYIAIPSLPGVEPENYYRYNGERNYSVLQCTDIATGALIYANSTAMVINPFTGAPVSNASVFHVKRPSVSTRTKLGETNTDGFLDIKKISGNIIAQKGDDKYSRAIYMYSPGDNELIWQSYARIFTDMAIYRPGDTISYSAVAYESKSAEHRLLRDKKLTIILKNANYVSVDTTYAVTDKFGRIDGKFIIPENELTGYYHIVIFDKKSEIANRNIMVSDYKLPTFYVNVEKVLNGTPADGDVSISGFVKTYSGMPMGNIPVALTLSVSDRRWWFNSNNIDFYSVTDTTAADGTYTIILPKELLESSPIPGGRYTAQLTATSLSGESQQTERQFNTGKSNFLIASMPENIDATSIVKLDAKVTAGAIDGAPVATTITCRLTDSQNPEITYELPFESAKPEVDMQSIPVGCYTASFTSSATPGDTVTCSNICIYRPTVNKSPSCAPLWVPDNNQSVAFNGKKGTLLYGTSAPETHVLIIIYNEHRTIERRWIKVPAGLHRLEVTLPDDTDKAKVHMYASYGYNQSQAEINVHTAQSERKLSIITESFRDRLVPGAEEIWTFRTVNADSAGVETAMILDMYNSALDVLETQSWTFTPINSFTPSPIFNFPHTKNTIYENVNGKINLLSTKRIDSPVFNTYGMGFGFGIHIRGSRSMMLMKSANSVADQLYGAAAGVTVQEHKSQLDEVVTVAENAVFDAVEEAPHLKLQDTEDAADSGAASEPQTKSDNFTYRKSEVPLAFFRPSLTTDRNGCLTLKFRVPDANATWQFNAVAYDSLLTTSSLTRSVMANKPVMVQPNLPRFVRTGDNITVSATVMNNSDSKQAINVTTQLFDAANSVIYSASDTVINIIPGGSEAIDINFTAPADAPFIGYRIKASTDIFADGEQALIPILPSVTPVIETQPFYISPDTTQFSMKLPKLAPDARVTLQFCDNPTWYVVTALPGLRQGEIKSAQSAADAIFSAAVAEGILQRNPTIKQALKMWTSSTQTDSVLTSMLERNADLKTVLLQATPWMMDARSDTERMQRLALLFDKKEISNVYAKSISTLKKLQRDNGGWAWIDQCTDASEWATAGVLTTLGRLNRLGFMPSDKALSGMIQKALEWHQNEVVKDFRKYPDNEYLQYMQYATIRDLWPQYPQSATGKQITDRVVQRIVASWKNMSVGAKAQAALLLYNHAYKNVAGNIMESIMEFAVQSPSQGMWWPSVGDIYGGSMTQLLITTDALTALQTINPGSADIDAIRQWLILQKEARNWGAGSVASQVIATILSSSDKWIEPAGHVTVTIDDKKITPSDIEHTLGYFRTDISSMASSGAMLKIDKTTHAPSWGAIYSQSRNIMSEVEASSCEAVSIEKKFFKQVGNDWIETERFNVGDRVKVQLLIHANRDMEYIAITDDRAACLEPVEQTPAPLYSEGLCFYRENRDSATNMFVTRMPKGTYMLSYELWANNAGTFASGIATIQSQYAPQLTAHSAGNILNVIR